MGKLAKIFNDTALIVIDVQRGFAERNTLLQYFGTRETERVAEKIASAVPEFRKLGIPVYIVTYGSNYYRPERDTLYKLTFGPNDCKITKYDRSAFKGSNIEEILNEDGRKNLLMCGFNYVACVRDTAVDGRLKGFNVTLLQDLTGNGKGCLGARDQEETTAELLAHGVVLDKSGNILNNITRTQPRAA